MAVGQANFKHPWASAVNHSGSGSRKDREGGPILQERQKTFHVAGFKKIFRADQVINRMRPVGNGQADALVARGEKQVVDIAMEEGSQCGKENEDA